MVDVDPDTLLEWLSMGQGEERDMQLIALEQLCMLLLMSDNVDRCFESCPPRVFLPALCRVFLDESAPENVLEVTARAITYYLDVSAECTRRIVAVEGAVKMLCNRLVAVDLQSRTSKDLAEQCVKVLELMCTREAGAIFDAGGLQCTLTFINEFGTHVHKDTLHSSMSVVSRLCSRMEPQDTQLETCAHSLSTLLKHEDAFVSDSALRCFASVADRFTRRGMDPAPLAKHGLIDELLERLAKAGTSTNDRPTGNGSTPDAKNVSPSVTTVISLLSALCRGSPVITELLLHSQLPEAIDKALQGDERCILDTMRLVNLLLVLLFEGRKALPKAGLLAAPGSMPGLKRIDSTVDRSHRQLIDCIRSKDTDALVDAIDNGGFEVNFMDDVGQTLLNWASAFGTLEMVEFLCERGADVNRGQRSSSLHYAACFGRPVVAKVLLKYGADPELRDEDGKTPADKARERHDEGHREVLEILQSPSEWMSPFNSGKNGEAGQKPKEDGEKKEEDESNDGMADPETAASYVFHLLPLFIKSYQTSMVASVKKAALGLIRKMVYYSNEEHLKELTKSPGFVSGLVEVLATVLENEDDDDGHMSALNIIQDLLAKANDVFIEHFARLGVISKVSEIVGPLLEEENDEDEIDGAVVSSQEKKEDSSVQDDANEIVQGRPYHWRDWCLIRSRDCLYLWNESCALELSNGSNGWFRFILDNKLATMYSSGSPEGGSDSSESRGEFLEKLQRARGQVKSDVVSKPILSSSNPVSLLVGNWSFACQTDSELSIYNSDGQQTTVLREDLPGFMFESNRGTKHTFTAETSLGAEFASGWSGKRGKKFVSKAEALKLKVKTLAKDVQEKYFQTALSSPREVVTKLRDIVRNLYACCDAHEKDLNLNDDNTWEKDMVNVLKTFLELLKDDKTVSSYELHTSGVVRALLHCLSQHPRAPDDEKTSCIMVEKAHQRIELFKSAFGESVESFTEHLESFEAISPAVFLIRKLIAVLEMSERLPVYSFESLGTGLQILTRRLRFLLDRAPGESSLIDRSGGNLRIEPLTTVEALTNYLSRMVAKQWFDFERNSFSFIKKVKNSSQTFTYISDFDDSGILYWIGTNGRTTNDWVNPASVGLVVVSSSEGRALPYGKLEDIVSRDAAALNCHTNDDKNAWFSIDLGLFVIPNCYTLRHARGYGRSALRNWLFQVSKDSKTWLTIHTHADDTSLNEPGSTASWHVKAPEDSEGWRYIRIHQNGKNASSQTHYLSLSGFELYGTIVNVVEEPLGKPVREHESVVKRQRRMKHLLKHFAGKAARGLDSKWKEGEVLPPSVEAALARELSEDWVEVSWAEGLPSSLRHVAASSRARVKVLTGEPSSLYTHVAKFGLKANTTGESTSRVTIKVEPNSQSVSVPAGTLSSNVKNLEKDTAEPVVSTPGSDQAKSAATELSTPQSTQSTDTLVDSGASGEGVEDVVDIHDGGSSPETSTDASFYTVAKALTLTSAKAPTETSADVYFAALAKALIETSVKAPTETSQSGDVSLDTGAKVSTESGTKASGDSGNEAIPDSTAGAMLGADSKAASETGFEAALETGADTASETGAGAGTEIASEAGTEAASEAGTETASEASTEAASEAGSEAASETGAEAALETGVQTSLGVKISGVVVDVECHDPAAVSGADEKADRKEARPSNDGKHLGVIYTIKSPTSGKAAISVASTASTASSNPTSDSEVENIPMDCTLLAELEDETDDLPEPDDEDDDDDDDDDDEDNEENEDEYEEVDECEVHNSNARSRRTWDDDFCLKRQFTALIPAFDPRPGRSNVQQIQDIEVPSQVENETPSPSSSSLDSQVFCNPEIKLVLKGPSTPGVPDISIPLCDPKATLFSYIHKVALMSGKLKTERLRRVWESTYTVAYHSVGKNAVESNDNANDTNEKKVEENDRWSVKYVESNVGTDALPKCEVISYLQEHADSSFLRHWKLTGTTKSIRKNRNCSQLVAAYKEFCKMYPPSPTKRVSCSSAVEDKNSYSKKSSLDYSPFGNKNNLDSIEDILKLIRVLYSISATSMEEFGENVEENFGFIIPADEFNSKKITTKLIQQIKDPLVSSSGSLPSWCESLMSSYPMLFPFDTRQMYFNCSAFGCARCIIWLQTSRDAAVERSRAPSSRREDQHEFRIGRLKHERVRVSRDDGLLDCALKVLSFHSKRKAILEFEFEGEEGTGLGPTLEFYSLVAAALQRKNLAIFICDDDTSDDAGKKVDIGHGVHPPGYYIQRAGGLFPAPLPQDCNEMERVCKLFSFLGIFLAKSLQDNRLVDLPLSRSFLKLLCNGGGDNSMVPTLPTAHAHGSRLSVAEALDESCSYDEERESVRNLTTNELDCFKKAEDDVNDINKLECELSKGSFIEEELPKKDSKQTDIDHSDVETPLTTATTSCWFSGLLDETDLVATSPHQGTFVRQLSELAEKKMEIMKDGSLSKEEKKKKLHELLFTTSNGMTCRVEDLGLTFQYFPTSRVYKFSAVDLKPNGQDYSLTLANIEEYVHLMTDLCLYSGIKKQMDAFRDGFNKVFPMEKLQPFSPSELQLMLSGEQVPDWTKEDVLSYTEPKYGFTRDSPVYQRFVNVLAEMSGDEKKAFLQFTTGCSSLPPGGLANLHPHLTVVRKEGEGDGSYPSVNTCVHYLKLPEYSSENILREKLLAATKEKGFHLN